MTGTLSTFILAPSWDFFTFFGFEVHVSVLLGCVYLVGGYLYLIGPLRRRYGWSDEPVSRKRITAWMTAVAVIFFALNGPLHSLSDDYLFSAHMIQHMLLMLIMPPLLLVGLPPWLVSLAVRRPRVRAVARFLTHPLVAFLAYNTVFIGWHVPQMYNLALEVHGMHIVQHLLFMVVAVMMWWQVVNPVKELERVPEGIPRMMYIFAFGIFGIIVAVVITFSDEVLYPWYEAAARISALSPLQDQRLGGLIMWIPGMLLYWVAISVVYFRWTREEYESWS